MVTPSKKWRPRVSIDICIQMPHLSDQGHAWFRLQIYEVLLRLSARNSGPFRPIFISVFMNLYIRGLVWYPASSNTNRVGCRKNRTYSDVIYFASLGWAGLHRRVLFGYDCWSWLTGVTVICINGRPMTVKNAKKGQRLGTLYIHKLVIKMVHPQR